MYVYTYVHMTVVACRGQKGITSLYILSYRQLWTVNVGAGNWSLFLCKGSQSP